jgi:curli biogenesis system outer membrane secretion channel CsgG
MRLTMYVLVLWLVAPHYAEAAQADGFPLAHAPRIAVMATTDGKPDLNLTDALAALLSQDDKVEVYERRQLAELLKEDVLERSLSDPQKQATIGQLLGLDYLVTAQATTTPARCDLQIIDASSGVMLATITFKSTDSPTLAAGAERLLESVSAAHSSSGQTSIAVFNFTVSGNTATDQQAEAGNLAEQLRQSLSSLSLTVLDRNFTDAVIQEQLIHQDGFTSGRQTASMLGADFLVEGVLENNKIRLHLLSASSQKTETQSFALTFENGVPLVGDDAVTWVAERVRPEKQAAGWIEPTLQPEALQPFYEGLRAFQSGRFFDAIDFFSEAYHLNDQFREAYEWEARCYDALGLAGLGDGERRYLAKDFADRGVSRPVSVRQSAGITFVGLEGEGFSPPEIRHYEMTVIDALSRESSLDLHLPTDLARFRDEYDLFVGLENHTGTTWASTPNFLTRWSLLGLLKKDGMGNASVSWTLSDTISSKRKTSVSFVLPEGVSVQQEKIADSVQQLVKEGAKAENTFPPATETFSTADAERNLNSNGSAESRAVLELALNEPADPLLWGHELDKNGYDKRGLQGFLNFALRDYLIPRLPSDSLYGQWLEITQLARSIPFKEVGQFYSGQKIDAYSRLERFRKLHPGTITGCFATYMLLYDNLSRLSPADLLQQLTELRKQIPVSLGAGQVVGLEKFEGMADHLIALARLAGGEKDPTLLLPDGNFPQRLFPELSASMTVQFAPMDSWECNEWKEADDPEWLNRQDEARAALLLLGRRVYNRVLDPNWLKAHPDSIVLLSFAIASVYAVNHGTGRPVLHPFDQQAEAQDFEETVAYCKRGLTDDLQKSTNLTQEAFFEHLTEKFVCYLCNFAFASTVDDKSFDQIRTQLATAVETARIRLGDISFRKEDLIWMKMPRLFPGPGYFNDVNTEDFYYDPAVLLSAEETAGEQSWATSPVRNQAWLRVMDDPFFMKRLPPEALAKILRRYEPRMDVLFGRRNLSEADAAFVLDFALMLLHAHEFPVAEKWLRAVGDQPEIAPSRTSRFTDYQANALLHLGFVLMALGREAEAPPILKRAIHLTDNRLINVIERVYGHSSVNPLYRDESDGVRSMAMRFLEDVRLDLLTEELPPNVRRISINVPKLGNLRVDYYVRIPKNYDSHGKESHRILIIAPSLNGATPDYCLDANPWAQFADSQGLFLIAPQFLALFDDRMNTFLNPQEWSGEATLQVVNQLATTYRVEPNRLLLHGFGGGGEFVNRFVRWMPDRVAAASSHSTVGWDYYEVTPGLHPLRDLKNVPQLVTCGAEDDFSVNSDDRLNRGIQFCTALKGAGAPFLWKAWPETAVGVSPNMERMAQAFLAYYAKNPLGTPEFIGDLRDWKYVSTGDARVAKIPARWRQSLPNSEIAALWGLPL